MLENATYDTQKFKLIIKRNHEMTLSDIQHNAYLIITKDRRHYINIGDGYAILRLRDLENYHNVKHHIVKIESLIKQIIRAKNLQGHIICKKCHQDNVLKKTKLVKK